MRKCCVVGCHSNYGKPYVPTFLFPRDTSRRRLWERNIGQTGIKISNNIGVCIKHFTEDSFFRYNSYETDTDNTVRRKVKLKPDAAPTIFPGISHADLEGNGVRTKTLSVATAAPSAEIKDMNFAEMNEPEEEDDNDIQVIEVRKSNSGPGYSPSERLKDDEKAVTKEDSLSKRRSSSVGSNSSTGSTETSKPSVTTPKRKKPERNPPTVTGRNNDCYCWVCHKEGVALSCMTCKRAYHQRCAGEMDVPENWVCVECRKIMAAEDVDNRSTTLSEISLEKFYMLLKCCVIKLKCRSPAAFHQPVPVSYYSSYLDYVIHPMDLSLIEKNIKQKLYGCTEAFLADVKWIQHNSCVFNGAQHPLTLNARSLVKTSEADMAEIEICPDCYYHACTRSKYWFSDVCSKPHPIVWAKLKGFPYWPAKVVRIVDDNVDARFFGAHDRAWVPVTQCYHLSKEMPTSSKPKKKGTYESALEELNIHVQHLKKKYGVFEYAPYRTPFNPDNKFFMYHGIDMDKVMVKEDIVKEDIVKDDVCDMAPSSVNSVNSSFSLNGTTPPKLPSLLSDTSCDAKLSQRQSDSEEVSFGKVKRALSFEDPSPPCISSASDSETTNAAKTVAPTGVFEVSEKIEMIVDDSIEHKTTASNHETLKESNARVESDLEGLEKLQNSIDRAVKMYSGETGKDKVNGETKKSETLVLDMVLDDKETKTNDEISSSIAKDQLPVGDAHANKKQDPVVQDSSSSSEVTSSLPALATTVVKKYDFFSQKLDATIESIKLRVPNLETDLPDESSEDEEDSEDADEGKDDSNDEESDSASSESEDTSSSSDESSEEDENCESIEAQPSSKSLNKSCISDDSDKVSVSEESNEVDKNADKSVAEEKEVVASCEEESSENKSESSREELEVPQESLVVEEVSKELEVEIDAEVAQETEKDEASVVRPKTSDIEQTTVKALNRNSAVTIEVEEPSSISSKYNESVAESNVNIEASRVSNCLSAEEIEQTRETSLEVEILTDFLEPVKKDDISMSNECEEPLQTQINKLHVPIERDEGHSIQECYSSFNGESSGKNNSDSSKTNELKEFSKINLCSGNNKEQKENSPNIMSDISSSEGHKFLFSGEAKIVIHDNSFTLVRNIKDSENQSEAASKDKNVKTQKISISQRHCSSEDSNISENFFPRTEIERRKLLVKNKAEDSVVAQPVKNKFDTLASDTKSESLVIDLDEIVVMETEELETKSGVDATNENSKSSERDSKTSKEKENYELRKRPPPPQVIDIIDISSSDSESESTAKESNNDKHKEQPETLKLNIKDSELIDDLLIDLSSNSLPDDQKTPSKSESDVCGDNVLPIAPFANSLKKDAVNCFTEKVTEAGDMKLSSILPQENSHDSNHTQLSITNVVSCQENYPSGLEHADHSSFNRVPIALGLKRTSSDTDDVINDAKKPKVHETPPVATNETIARSVDICSIEADSSSFVKSDDSLVKNNSVAVSEEKLRSLLEKSPQFKNCDKNSVLDNVSASGGDSNKEKRISSDHLQNDCQSEKPSLSQLSNSGKLNIIPVLNDSKGKGEVCPHCATVRSNSNSIVPHSKKHELEIVEYKSKISKLERDVKKLKEVLHQFKYRSEKIEWYHPQEVSELKHNMNLTLMEMRCCLEADMKGTLERLKQKYEDEKLNAVNEAKGKQWCASCLEPSIFYCCWNTSYCSYSCQKHHWPQHRFSCTQVKTPPLLKSHTVDFVKIAKKPNAEGAEMSTTTSDRRVLLVMKQHDEGQQPAAVSQTSVNIMPSAVPVSVASQNMSNSIPSADSTTVSHTQVSQAVPSKIQYITPKNQIQLVNASSVTTTTQSNTPLSFLPSQSVQIVLAPVKNLGEKVITSTPSCSKPAQDSSEIITKVRSRQTDLTTAIQLLNKMNKETEETLKKKRLDENAAEELVISLPKSSIDYSEASETSPSIVGEQNLALEEILFEDEPVVLPDDEDDDEEGEDSNDSSSNKMVSLGPEVEISEKKLRQCEKVGTTPTKLVRCLLTVFFSMQELAKSSVFGRKSNVTKQTRPALSMKIVSAILGYVSQKFPNVQRTDLVLAMNLKCKEARKRTVDSLDTSTSSSKKPKTTDVTDEKSKAVSRTVTTVNETSPSETSSSASSKCNTTVSSNVTAPCVLPQLSRALTTTIRNVIPKKAVQLVSTTKAVTLSSSTSRIVTIPRSLQCARNVKQQISIQPKTTIITAERGPGGVLQIPSSVLQVSGAMGKSLSTSAKTLVSSATPLIYTVKNASKLNVTSSTGDYIQASTQSSMQGRSEAGQRPIVILEVPPSATQQDVADVHSQEPDASNHVITLS